MKKKGFLLLLLVATALPASPRLFCPAYSNLGNPFLDVAVTPGAVMPLFSDADLFTVGASAVATAELKLPKVPFLYTHGELGYGLLPVRAQSLLSVIPLGIGLDFKINALPRVEVKAALSGGYYIGALHSSPFLGEGEAIWDGNPYAAVRFGPSFYFAPKLSLGFEASYANYFGLVNFFGVSLSGSYHIPIQGRGPVDIKSVEVDRLFPALYQFYDREPPGRAVIANKGRFPISGLEVSFYLDPYMSRPNTWQIEKPLAPGEEREIALQMLFNDRILAIVESAKFSGELVLSCECFGKRHQTRRILPVEIRDRNSLTWEDDRKAALFVTEKDPDVLELAGSTVAAVKHSRLRPINPVFRMAAGLHSALSVYGMSYIADPNSPYTEVVKDGSSIDFLRFPRQTLSHRAGDCDDLTILFCALLESINMETAFITIPGHIYAAVSLGLTREQAAKIFASLDDLIFLHDIAWLPVEVTEMDGGFLLAWQLGAREWRENREKGEAHLYPVHEAWELYPPVGLPAGDSGFDPPAEEAVLDLYNEEMIAFIQAELAPKVEECQKRITESGNHPKEINALGVLYARYGLFDEAKNEFRRVLERDEYVPALVNLGNIYFLEEDYDSALVYFERAHKVNPASANVLLCLARTHYQLELYEKAREYYTRLKEVEPDLAGRYAYLVVRTKEEVRAREFVSFGRDVLWEEEE
jgi:tetratricopeptide (TPR) repeat protein